MVFVLTSVGGDGPAKKKIISVVRDNCTLVLPFCFSFDSLKDFSTEKVNLGLW